MSRVAFGAGLSGDPGLGVGVVNAVRGGGGCCGCGGSLLRWWVQGLASVLFRSWWCDRFSFELFRLLNSNEGRHAARTVMELAGTVLAPLRERLGLNGCWRESMCQAAVRILRATADLAALPLPRLERSV